MDKLITGRQIIHPIHGECTVTFVGESYIGVVFDNDKHALLRKESFFEEPDSVVSPLSEPEETPASWPENTFFHELPDQDHSLGSHWRPFYEDLREELLHKLPEVTSQSDLHRGFGHFCKAPRESPSSWAEGAHLIWPSVHQGIVTTIKAGKTANELMSAFPYFSDGIQVSLRLERVIVWNSGVEAQIEARWGDAGVTFFDTHFLTNRNWYEAGQRYDFFLIGIAYEAGAAEIMELPCTLHPDQIAWEKILAEQKGETPRPVPSTLHLDGTAVFLEIPEWDKDDYKFRGPVSSVREVPDILGQSAWMVRVTVMRFGDVDADLDILITRRAWEGDKPPEAGQDIEGTLWLQGRLWSSRDWANAGQDI